MPKGKQQKCDGKSTIGENIPHKTLTSDPTSDPTSKIRNLSQILSIAFQLCQKIVAGKIWEPKKSDSTFGPKILPWGRVVQFFTQSSWPNLFYLLSFVSLFSEEEMCAEYFGLTCLQPSELRPGQKFPSIQFRLSPILLRRIPSFSTCSTFNLRFTYKISIWFWLSIDCHWVCYKECWVFWQAQSLV